MWHEILHYIWWVIGGGILGIFITVLAQGVCEDGAKEDLRMENEMLRYELNKLTGSEP